MLLHKFFFTRNLFLIKNYSYESSFESIINNLCDFSSISYGKLRLRKYLHVIFLSRYRNYEVIKILKFEKRNNNDLHITIYLTKLDDFN